MELVLKTSGQKCLVGSNPTASAITGPRARFLLFSQQLYDSRFHTKQPKTVNAYKCYLGEQDRTTNDFVIKLKPLTALYSLSFTYG